MLPGWWCTLFKKEFILKKTGDKGAGSGRHSQPHVIASEGGCD